MNNNWDEYYIGIARAVAVNSKCLSRRIGAVLVKDKAVISTGYNGPPRGVPHCAGRYELDEALLELLRERGVTEFRTDVCPRRTLGFRSGEATEICPASHAEANAIVQAARSGVSTNGATLYLCGEVMPCRNCTAMMINAGIIECVVETMMPYDRTGLFLLKHSGLKIRTCEKNAEK